MLGSRLLSISWLGLLCVSGIQVTQALMVNHQGQGHLPQKRAIETTVSFARDFTSADDALDIPALAMGEPSQVLTHWSKAIPDQGRPVGRHRGGSSR